MLYLHTTIHVNKLLAFQKKKTDLICKVLKERDISPPFQVGSQELSNLFVFGFFRVLVQRLEQLFVNDKVLISLLIVDLDISEIWMDA